MGLVSAFLAALFAAASNLFMRRSIDAGGTTKAYLVIQMSIAFLLAVLLGPVASGSYTFHAPLVSLGLGSGLVLALMLTMLGKALEKGPPGFTFSILSAATVLPGLIMAVLFGVAHGFIYTPWHGVGSLLVLAGLYWAGKGTQGLQDRRAWLLFAAGMFSLHVLLLVIFQWRALLLNLPHPEEMVSFFTAEVIRNAWYMPMLYLGAAFFQFFLYLNTEKRMPNSKEWVYGVGGGIANSLCTFFVIQATELATGLENAIIFPLFSIGTIVLSNLWGQRLYAEKVNWRACQVCMLGLFVGTVDWKVVLSAIGL
jgi:drug/metabolite transporter (DMT)-like permease